MASMTLVNIFSYLLSNIFTVGIPFLLLPFLSRYLSPADLVDVGVFQSLYIFFLPIVGLSLNSYVTRMSYNCSIQSLRLIVSNCLLIQFIWSLVIVTSCYIFSGLIDRFLDFNLALLPFAVATSTAFSIFTLYLSQLIVRRKALHHLTIQILFGLFNIALSLYLIIFYDLGASGRIIGITTAFVLFAVISLALLQKQNLLKLNFDQKILKSSLKFSIPLVPHELSTFFKDGH